MKRKQSQNRDKLIKFNIVSGRLSAIGYALSSNSD